MGSQWEATSSNLYFLLDDLKTNFPRLENAENDIKYLKIVIESELKLKKDGLQDLKKNSEEVKGKNNLGVSN